MNILKYLISFLDLFIKFESFGIGFFNVLIHKDYLDTFHCIFCRIHHEQIYIAHQKSKYSRHHLLATNLRCLFPFSSNLSRLRKQTYLLKKKTEFVFIQIEMIPRMSYSAIQIFYQNFTHLSLPCYTSTKYGQNLDQNFHLLWKTSNDLEKHTENKEQTS